MKWIVFVLALLTLLLAGCVSRATPPPPPTATPIPTPMPTREGEIGIPFETVAVNQLDASLPVTVDPPELTTDFTPFCTEALPQEPLVFLVVASEDVTTFQDWIPVEIRTAIGNVDFQEFVVLAFFEALSPASDGYIERIATYRDNKLTVYATLRIFSAGTGDVTFPAHIVKIRRQDVPFPLESDTPITLVTRTELIGSNAEQ